MPFYIFQLIDNFAGCFLYKVSFPTAFLHPCRLRFIRFYFQLVEIDFQFVENVRFFVIALLTS